MPVVHREPSLSCRRWVACACNRVRCGWRAHRACIATVPQQDRLESFDTRDGLPTREFSDRPFLAEDQGRLWIGSEDGLISVRHGGGLRTLESQRICASSSSVSMVPEGLRELRPGVDGELQPSERELTMAVRLNTLARAHAQRFSFRLVGWDEDWSDAAGFAGAPLWRAGGWRLHLAGREPGTADGQGAANTLEWQFTVLPPWWRSRAGPGSPMSCCWRCWLAAIERWRQLRRRSAERWQETRRQAEWAERTGRRNAPRWWPNSATRSAIHSMACSAWGVCSVNSLWRKRRDAI